MPGMTLDDSRENHNDEVASMRPRLNAGDDNALQSCYYVFDLCFNEAPAKCRG